MYNIYPTAHEVIARELDIVPKRKLKKRNGGRIKRFQLSRGALKGVPGHWGDTPRRVHNRFL